MTVEEAIVYGKEFLSSTHTKMLLADLLGKNPLALFEILNDPLTTEQETIFKARIQKLKEEKPIQYVMGTVNFYGNVFEVDERVLIPRFETEELIEKTLFRLEKKFADLPLVGVDLGTGSGAIGITLKKKRPSLSMTLIDISNDALEVARKNSQKLAVEVMFLENDFLSGIQNQYDFIISNPPYIKNGEEIEKIVSKHEPSLALYAGVDGLDCYRKILADCKKNLKEKFLIAFEIGMTQGEDLCTLAKETFSEEIIVEIEKDLQGRDRFCFIESRER